MRSTNQERERLVKKYGLEFVRVTGSGHLQYRHPKVPMLFVMGGTPGDHRAWRNMEAFIKRTLRQHGILD